MKRPLIVLLLCLVGLAIGQEAPDTYGKTEAEILSMGQSKWYEFYTSKAGESTMAMSNAYGIYEQVAEKRNDQLIAKDAERGGRAKKLRKLLMGFGAQSISIASDKTGGGTMWGPISAQMSADVEDIVYSFLTKGPGTAKPIVVSKVSAELKAVKESIEEEHHDKSSAEFFKYKDAVDALAQMKSDYHEIVLLAKNLGRADSDRMLGFCLNWAHVAASKEGD